MVFHEGEQAVQTQAGVRTMAERIGRGIHAVIPPIAQQFLHQQTIAIAASVDGDGRVWASMLTGVPGFLTALDEHTLWINTKPVEGDCLLENLKVNPSIGLLAIQFAERQRIRLNGTATIHPDGLYVAVQQAYSNCQKYIQARLLKVAESKATVVGYTDALTEVQQHMITQADTFFIASFHPISGADASHRGGYPGFVQVVDPTTLEFPDYSGNNMFNTLGNLFANPNSGLLFLDFENGNLLQLAGQADVIWNADHAERVVRYHVRQVTEIANAIALRSKFLQYSPFNIPRPK